MELLELKDMFKEPYFEMKKQGFKQTPQNLEAKIKGTNKGTIYDSVEWKYTDVKVMDYKTGKTVYSGDNLEFPFLFSQRACDIIASKYFRKTQGVEEKSYAQVIDRMVGFWTLALIDEGMLTKDQAGVFYDDLAFAMLNQWIAPNSPQWFNTGLDLAYNINTPTNNNYFYDPKEGRVVESKSNKTRTQASACFILPCEDKLLGPDSISDHYVQETKLFKGGSGAGTNFSKIRGTGEPLSGGGVSSGIMPFLKGLDRNAGAIKSGGTTRRAAKMVTLDIDHPDIMDFITWKAKEEQKVRDLGKVGYDTGFEGEAYETVSGQNANNSIGLTDEFMRIIEDIYAEKKPKDTPFTLKPRTKGGKEKVVKAWDLWEAIVESAWACGDPSPLFLDTINEANPCWRPGDNPDSPYRIRTTNPCGEYAFIDSSACNLASINLMAVYNKDIDGKIDWDKYRYLITLGQLFLEASIHWGQFPTPQIAQNSYDFRATGLGYANLGGLLLRLRQPYDSDEARWTAQYLTHTLTTQSWYVSGLMAKVCGPFPGYKDRAPYMMDSMYDQTVGICHEAWVDDVPSWMDSMLDQIMYIIDDNTGVRNAQVTALAPTGTISLAMDCDTSGVEPYFAHSYHKSLSGGGEIQIESAALKEALDEGYKITDPLFDCALPFDGHDGYITPEGHLMMLRAIASLISGGISKTINMPNECGVEGFTHILTKAWEFGIKGLTLYRDGCKASQPLTTKKDTAEEVPGDNQSPQRHEIEGIREGRTHAGQIEETKIYTTVNRDDDGNIAEIYTTTDREGSLTSGLLNSLSKLSSIMLQYSIPSSVISEALKYQKFPPAGFVSKHPYIKSCSSISDYLAKILEIESGDYSRAEVKPEGAKTTQNKLEKLDTGETCPICHSTNMAINGACKVCLDCGATTGCS